MFGNKYQPVYAPETEAGAPEADTGGAPPPAPSDTPEPHDGPGSGRSEIRKSLESGFEKARKTEDEAPDAPVRTKGKRGDRVGSRLAAMPDSGASEAAPQAASEEAEDAIPDSSPPEGWSKEAKEDWSNASDNIRAAVLKREIDINRGVRALQARYADIDQVLGPRAQQIQAFGHTPAGAVNQLFAWFDSLAANPAVAFPALARSFGYDISQFVRAPNQPAPQQQRPPQQQPAQGQPGQQANGQQRPPQQQAPVGWTPQQQAWVNQQFGKAYQAYQELNQELQAQRNYTAQQNQRATERTLSTWAQDKPYYEQVRMRMAELLNAGAIPLRPDGEVDLDRAYDEACHGLPEVRNLIYQAHSAHARAEAKKKADAERKAQAAQADKALRAATSLPLNAPGLGPSAKNGQVRQRKSVKESLQEAIEQYRDV